MSRLPSPASSSSLLQLEGTHPPLLRRTLRTSWQRSWPGSAQPACRVGWGRAGPRTLPPPPLTRTARCGACAAPGARTPPSPTLPWRRPSGSSSCCMPCLQWRRRGAEAEGRGGGAVAAALLDGPLLLLVALCRCLVSTPNTSLRGLLAGALAWHCGLLRPLVVAAGGSAGTLTGAAGHLVAPAAVSLLAGVAAHLAASSSLAMRIEKDAGRIYFSRATWWTQPRRWRAMQSQHCFCAAACAVRGQRKRPRQQRHPSSRARACQCCQSAQLGRLVSAPRSAMPPAAGAPLALLPRAALAVGRRVAGLHRDVTVGAATRRRRSGPADRQCPSVAR